MATDYLTFFNLNDDPFRLTPDTAYFYNSPAHATALQSLEYCVTHKEGFCVLTGDPGTGKTTIQRLFTERWKDRAEIALIMTPRLLPDEFFRAILDDFKIPLSDSKNEMLKSFRDFLLTHASNDKRIAIIVDEAQELPDTTLEELRLLSNLETEKEKLLQIILIGQPELSNKLLRTPLRQLNQRITVRVKLNPLTAPETSDYINTRLIKGGNSSLLFNQKAKELIYSLSKGIPRTINLLASRGLMSSFLEGSHEVLEKHIELGAADVMEATVPVHTRSPLPVRTIAVAAAGICAAVAIGAAAYNFTRKNPDNDGKETDQSAIAKQVMPRISTARPIPLERPADAPPPISFAATVAKETSGVDSGQVVFQSFNAMAAAWNIPQMAQFTRQKGTPLKYLANLALQGGMELINFDGNAEGIVEMGYPLILEIKPSSSDKETYRALTGVINDKYLISPSLGGKELLTKNELNSIWHGKAVILWKNYEKIPAWLPNGDRSPATIGLQKLLGNAGIAVEKSGVFDQKTGEALKSFQKLKGLEVTGRPGPKTLLYLYQNASGYFRPVLKQGK
ncbi:MAG: AAA family ATPase [Desulfuromonadaceae bacterium]|nr:AAA family ATPase [Desulfuromonadaceae bacterium]MDD5104087.1 AAA family ATPase [Desulfuromonadaceae bacterium]